MSNEIHRSTFELEAAIRIYAAMLTRGIALDGWSEEGAVDEAWRLARLFVERMPKVKGP